MKDHHIDTKVEWDSLTLDSRLDKAIKKMNWVYPTLIQSQSIPLALEGKDVLAKAPTGCGKTGAFSIPVVQKILNDHFNGEVTVGVKAIVLIPTTELTQQVKNVFNDLIRYCNHLITVYHVASDTTINAQIPRLAEMPDILIATPARLVKHLEQGNILLDQVQTVVIDEADLTLSYGYQNDIEKIKNYLPRIYQGFLMSATLSEDVMSLKKLVLHTPVILKLEEEQIEDDLLEQHVIYCKTDEKFLIIFTLIKLNLVRGKTLIFVNDIDRCFKLKLFLERFSIKSAVLNSELPQNSRFHIVEEFNRGVFDILIATDETDQSKKQETSEDSDDESSEEKTKKTTNKSKKDAEYGVSRGVDFRDVANVINFDFPYTIRNYVHRVGRTARAGHYGTALSFASESDTDQLAAVMIDQESKGKELKPYKFNMNVAEAFRYRVTDMLRSVTKILIKQAKAADLKKEILNSKKLRTHFEDNPLDLEILKHDAQLSHRSRPHLKTVPTYLMPSKDDLKKTLTNDNAPTGDIDARYRVAYNVKSMRNKRRKNRNNPLESFSPESGMGTKRKFDEISAGEKRPFKYKKRKKRRIDKISGKKFKSQKPAKI